MKRITSLSAAVVAAVLLTTSHSSAGSNNGVASPWEYGILSVDNPGFVVPCLDETLRVVADWPVRWREVWTPSGGYHYAFQYPPSTPSSGGYFILIGETSGTVYYSQNGMPAHEMTHAGPGELYRFRSHERYVSDDGVHLTIDWHFIITINANGELVTDMQLLDCSVR